MNNKQFGCLTIGLIVVLCLSVLLNFVLLIARSTSMAANMMAAEMPKFEEKLVSPGSDRAQKIALIHLRGMISSFEPGALGENMVEDVKLQLRQAADDPRVKAAVLYIDSPGGEVTASDMIYSAVRNFREKKPIVIYMGALAASGGYYVACGGSWLMANETTLTGSIGVIMQALNYESLMGKVGLQMLTFKSGKFKDMLSGSRQITPEEQEYVQAMVMQTYDRFVGIVARERGLPEEELRTGLADGRVLSGKDAFAGKLVHQLGEVEDAYGKARELGGAPGATVVRYETRFGLAQLFRILGKAEATKVEVDIARALTPKLEAGRLYYLPSYLVPQ